ncbi:hypothetical protein SAMN05660489_02257 [Pseudomonas sp. LAMO17WK12:I10]|nr:hypothetical protein H160_02342 [Pseudomonas sp. LAMO17WK12:I9]SNY27880.1 hypothetical protein SAMN05660489_02257 [Pseudomonas sp. LAMO17WK12:I10]
MGTTKTSGKYWRHGPDGTMVKAFKLRDWFGQESHGDHPPVAAAEPARLRSTASGRKPGDAFCLTHRKLRFRGNCVADRSLALLGSGYRNRCGRC